MGDNPGLLTYEVEAINIQIDALEKDKIELEERLRKLESENQKSGNVSVRHKIEVFKIQGLLGETLEKIDQLEKEKDEKSKKVQRLEVKTSNSTMNIKTEETPIERQIESRLKREIAAETEKWKKEKDELIEWVEQRLKAEKEAWVKSMNKNDEREKEVEMQELKARNKELTERLRRLELQVERKFGESSIRNHSDVWETVNDWEQRNTGGSNSIQLLRPNARRLEMNMESMTILVLGGYDGNIVYDNLVILKEGKWIELPLKLPEANSANGTIYLDGEIYIFGGTWEEKVYKLDKNLEWTRMADMNQKRYYITNSCLEWNGCIWVFGGTSDAWRRETLKSVESYDPKEDKWTEMQSMNHARYRVAAIVCNGKFMVCGGICDNIGLKSVECFDPESGVWTELDDLPSPLAEHAIVSYGNKLIILGGWRGEATETVTELSNCDGKQLWKELPSMKTSRTNFSAVVLNDEIYVIGGLDGTNPVVETEIFDGTKWRDGPDLPQKNSFMSAIVIPEHFADSLLNYRL